MRRVIRGLALASCFSLALSLIAQDAPVRLIFAAPWVQDVVQEPARGDTEPRLAVSSSIRTSTFVPIVLAAGGVPPDFYTSELTLANRGTLGADVELVYTAAAGGGSGTARTRLEAGRQIVVPNAIEYLRSLGLDVPSTGSLGTLRVSFSGISSPADAFASARTTTSVPEGRAGLAYSGPNVRALPVAPALGTGRISTTTTYHTTNYGWDDVFPSPAPAPTFANDLNVFRGTNPNGTWSLFAVDDLSGGSGSMKGFCVAVRTDVGATTESCSSQQIPAIPPAHPRAPTPPRSPSRASPARSRRSRSRSKASRTIIRATWTSSWSGPRARTSS